MITLADEVGDDSELAQAVRALLEADGQAGGFLSAPALGPQFQLSSSEGLADADDAAIGRRIGAYRLERRIASGGMGTVYLGIRDDDQFHKQVAVKLIKRGMDSEDILHRFRHERQLLANLEHPNIARLIDGGATGDGRPYLVMEYVDGRPIDRYCDENRLSINDRLRLFRIVCAAVQYAHQNLIVHRDLKPNNIVVAKDGIPKLLDFGVAKVLHEDDAARTQYLTATAERFITPGYASPEQVRGGRVGTPSDIYALGVLLYELLTGHEPYRLERHRAAELERVVCEQEPTRPSTIVAQTEQPSPPAASRTITVSPDSVSAKRGIDLRRLSRKLAGDLDNIVLTALRKEPQRRYSSVEQMSDDIRRHLEGLPVTARPDTIRYRAAKFVRRNAVSVGAGIVVFVALLASSITSTVLYLRADAARQSAQVAQTEAVTQRETAESISRFLQDMLGSIDPRTARGRDSALLRELLDDAAQRLDVELAGRPTVAAALHDTIGATYQSIARYEEAERHLRKGLELRQAGLGDDHLDTSASLRSLADFLRERNRYDEAEPLYRESLAIRKRELGDRHEDVATVLNGLGNLLELADRPAEAEACLREALDIRMQVLGPDHLFVGEAQGDLGLLLLFQDKPDDGDPLLHNALHIHRHHREDDPLALAAALSNVGSLHKWRHKYDEAAPLFRESLEIKRSLLEPGHPDIAGGLSALAAILEYQKDYAAAEPMYREALAIERETLGNGHRNVGTTLNNLAGMMEKLERYDEAEVLSREAVEVYRTALGKDHAWVGIGLHNLALLLEKRGDYEAAAPVVEECARIQRSFRPPGHWILANIDGLEGACLVAQGKYEEAEPRLLTSIEVLSAEFPDRHWIMQAAIHRLIRLYTAWGKEEDATPWQQRLISEERTAATTDTS